LDSLENLDDLLPLVVVVVVAAAATGMPIIWCPFKAQCVDVSLNQICF